MGQSVHPVFAPPEAAGMKMSGTRPVDLVHLARQTGGDRALEEEVLHLFLKQAASLAQEMRVCKSGDERKKAAHSLKGAARAVGAFEVARSADACETRPTEKRCLATLLREVDSTCDYISSLLR